jgi:pSer/pThr/pTyr-binding forkhead associated (FHA) protein
MLATEVPSGPTSIVSGDLRAGSRLEGLSVLLFGPRSSASTPPSRGQTFQVPRGKFIVGRETDCHLVLDSNSVSRHHCVLLLDDYTLRIRDLASKNGTFVNRDQTRTGERILVSGDTVRVADLVIRIELEAGASTPAASLETQDIGTETIDHAGHSPEKPKVDQPWSPEASRRAAKDS